MLRKKNRISSRLFPKKERPLKNIPSESFSLSIYSAKDNKEIKVSVIVSKKVAKTAVARNKIRRRFYSILKKEISYIKKNILLVIYVKKIAFEKKYSNLESEIKSILNKL